MNISNLIELNTRFSNKQTCVSYFSKLRWNGHVKCVFCGHDKVYELNGANKRFKCQSCKKHFSALKGTIFENSAIPLQKWFVAIYILSSHKKGISSIQLGKDIGVTQKTAWFMLQRIRYVLKVKSFEKQLDGVIQCDETYIGGKNKNRHVSKRVEHSQGRSLKDKTPVFGIMHNTGYVYTEVVPNTKAATIKPIIKEMVYKGSIVVTDEWKAYKNLSNDFMHISLKHQEDEFVRGAFHTNRIEGFWSLLKRGLYGIYHQVHPKHLHRYCDEFSFRYNTRKLQEFERFEFVMNMVGCRLTYNQLIA